MPCVPDDREAQELGEELSRSVEAAEVETAVQEEHR